jgi:hypothetical protein
MPRPGGSSDRTRSPVTVSAKREYSRVWPETFAGWSPAIADLGVQRHSRTCEKPPFPARPRVSWGVWPTARVAGWGGRDRTSEWWNQNPLPYRLATPQQAGSERAGRGRAASFRQRRSIGGVEPFQQARERILSQMRSANASLYRTLHNTPLTTGRLPGNPGRAVQISAVSVPGATQYGPAKS